MRGEDVRTLKQCDMEGEQEKLVEKHGMGK